MCAFRRTIKHVFCLPAAPTLLLVLSAALLLVFAFTPGAGEPVRYAAYALSAYALGAGGCRALRLVKLLWRKVQASPFGRRLREDTFFRSELSLYWGLALNLVYVLIKLVSGLRYRSLWFGFMAAYYALLTALRYVLLRHVRRRPSYREELRRLRLCGILLMPMNLILAGIVFLIVHRNHGSSYPGVLIYATAAYSFYAVISASVSLVRYRKLQSPVLSAVKAVKLTAALVSMLSLETAMISAFGPDAGEFRFYMTGISGAAVCASVLAMAGYMIIRPTTELKQGEDEGG